MTWNSKKEKKSVTTMNVSASSPTSPAMAETGKSGP